MEKGLLIGRHGWVRLLAMIIYDDGVCENVVGWGRRCSMWMSTSSGGEELAGCHVSVC
jgi:hypothetical protein